MRKGFIETILLITIGALTIIGSGLYSHYQTQQEIKKNNNLGSVIQTNLSDTIGTFRTNVNSSLTNLAANINTVTTTLATYGTIVTQNSPLATNAGGTATTTAPSDLQYLGANGVSPTWKSFVNGSGITVSTTATSTHFNTIGFDATQNIGFTGNNTFAGSSTFNGRADFNATTTLSATTTISGNNFRLTSASSTLGASNSTTTYLGNVVGMSKLLYRTSSTASSFSQAGEITFLTFTVPGGVLQSDNMVDVYIPMNAFGVSGNQNMSVRLYYGGVLITSSTFNGGVGSGQNNGGFITAHIFENGTSNQFSVFTTMPGAATTTKVTYGTSAIDSSIGQTISITGQNSANTGSDGLSTFGGWAILNAFH